MKNKGIWLQIAGWAICTALAVGFIFRVRTDNQKNAEHIAQLQQQANEREQHDNENQEILTDIYDKLYSQLEVQDFICWGDSAMAGDKDRTFADSFKKVAEENLFSPLTKCFGKVIENEDYAMPSIHVTNMGVSNEGLRQILVRAGVKTMELGEWIQIPAEDDPVTVRLMDDEAWNSEDKDAELKFAKQRDVGFGKVWIDDIEGTLIATDDWFDSGHPRYAFVRDEQGSRQSVGSGTKVEIESATEYIGDIPIFFFENDTGRSIDGFVSDVEDLVYRYANLEDEEEGEESPYDLPFVVIFSTNEGSDMDRAMSNAFGNNYIRNENLSSDMTERAYKKLAQKVYENLDEQGCFDSVKEKIALAVQEAEEL